MTTAIATTAAANIDLATAEKIIASKKSEYICKRIAKKFADPIANVRSMFADSLLTPQMNSFAKKCAERYDLAREIVNISENCPEVPKEEIAEIVIENAETENIEKESTETAEVAPEMTMLSKMKSSDIEPEISLSKLYKMKCRAEIVFFNKFRKMFDPTEEEVAEMKTVAQTALSALRDENPEYLIPENPVLELQTKENVAKSAFYITNAVSFNCNVRYR